MRTGPVLSHQHVSPPVVANLNPCPMTTDELIPLGSGVLLGFSAGEVIARLGAADSRFLDGPLTAHHDESPGMWEIGLQRLDCKRMDSPLLYPAVSGSGLEKKGVDLRPSSV